MIKLAHHHPLRVTVIVCDISMGSLYFVVIGLGILVDFFAAGAVFTPTCPPSRCPPDGSSHLCAAPASTAAAAAAAEAQDAVGERAAAKRRIHYLIQFTSSLASSVFLYMERFLLPSLCSLCLSLLTPASKQPA